MVYRRTPAVCARQETTRARILDSARALVAEGGFAGANMAHVAARAQVSVGTVYRYFPSKSDLVTEVVRRTCRRELAVVAAVAAGEGAWLERLHAAVTVFARRALRSGRVAYAIIADPTVERAESLRLEVRAELAAILAGLVRGGVAAGELPDQPPDLTGAALVGAVSEALIGPISSWARDTGEADAEWLIRAVGDLCVRAVAGAGAPCPSPAQEERPWS